MLRGFQLINECRNVETVTRQRRAYRHCKAAIVVILNPEKIAGNCRQVVGKAGMSDPEIEGLKALSESERSNERREQRRIGLL